jgi:hypothetical protein
LFTEPGCFLVGHGDGDSAQNQIRP